MSAGIGMTGIYIVLLIAILIVCAVVCFVVIKSKSELREGRKALTLMAMDAEKRGESTQSFIDEARARSAAADQFMADAEQRAQTVDSFIHDAKAGMVLIDSDILETKAYNEALAAEAYEKLAVLDENLSRIDETVNGIGEKVGELDLKEIIRAASQAAVMPRQISVEPIRKPVREKKVVMIDDRLAAPLQESGKVVSEAAEQAAEQAAETAENDAIA